MKWENGPAYLTAACEPIIHEIGGFFEVFVCDHRTMSMKTAEKLGKTVAAQAVVVGGEFINLGITDYLKLSQQFQPKS